MVLSISTSEKMCLFAASEMAARFGVALTLCYREQPTRGGVWWAVERLPPLTRLQNDGLEERSGSFFWDGESWRETTADRCVAIGGLWCCLTTKDWVWRWCSSASCRVSLLHGEKLSEVQRLFGLKKPKKTKKKRREVSLFSCCSSSFIPVPLFYVGTEPSSRVVHQAYSFPWDCLIGPVPQKGEAVQLLHLLQPGSPMRWHDPKLIWLPVTLVPAFYWFFVFYAPAFFFSSTSGVATERRMSISLSCLLGREKGKIYWYFPPWVPSISLSLSYFSFIIFLSCEAGEIQKKWRWKKPKHKYFSVSSEKHTYTRHSPQLAALGCGRRGLCDGGRPAGHALNTPTVLQRRGAGKGEAWENTEASKQQPVTRPTTHTLHYCPDTITMHKGGKSPSHRPRNTPRKRATV